MSSTVEKGEGGNHHKCCTMISFNRFTLAYAGDIYTGLLYSSYLLYVSNVDNIDSVIYRINICPCIITE